MNLLLERLNATRQYTEALCAPLSEEDCLPQKASFVSPPKWHLAHTTWFFEEMILCPFLPTYQRFDPAFPFLFNSYYNGMGERIARHERGMITRPSLDQVMAYRAHVDQTINSHFEALSEATDLLELGIHHEQQHQELLLTDLKYNFWHNPIRPVYDSGAEFCMSRQNKAERINVLSGLYNIGYDGEGFCFDNEKGQHQYFLNDFQIDSQLINETEYLAFIESGAYENPDLWLDEGWAWVCENTRKAPLYWFQENDQWYRYTLAGIKAISPELAVTHINYYEANAYANWRGARLPTEFEWEVASDKFDWGDAWEWCQSAYLPYPGFKPGAGAVGEYNGKFMVNQMVLRGASKATSKNHSRPTYRNFFHPQMQWQYSGIRLAYDT